MDIAEKVRIIQRLKNNSLRENILIPLFEAMGYIWIRDSQSKMKNEIRMIMYMEGPLFNTITGVSVLRDNIAGDCSKNGNASRIFKNIKNAITEPNVVENGVEETLNGYILVSLGKINQVSRDSIISSIKIEYKHVIIWFVDCEELVTYIDKYMPDFFPTIEKIEVLREDELTDNIIELLEKMNCKHVRKTHRQTGELGVDVVFEMDTVFGPLFCGAQIKRKKIHGNSKGDPKGNYSVIYSQAMEAIQIPHFHEAHNTEKMLDIFLVITSKEITDGAKSKLEKKLIHEKKRNIRFVDGMTLVKWFRKHTPELLRGDIYGKS
jgi:hypothetical protein